MAECEQRVVRVVALRWERTKSAVPASEVVERTGYSRSHCTDSLERAAKAGLLRRVETTQGRKRVAYEPTEQAIALLDASMEGAI